jgi:vacuolar-type H+-ATPase subunit D/Vma8
MGVFDAIKKGVTDAAVSAGTGAAQSGAIKKAEMELADLINKYDECYMIIGKRIAESLRSGEESSDAKVTEAFQRIQNFDLKRSELEVKIREIKGDKLELVEAAKLVKVEEDVEKDIAKCKELLEIGVDSQEEYDRKVATLRNKVTNFKQLDALDQALAKKLISEDDYKKKKASLLGQDIVE